jgi:E3 SUMO-protein ligase PIAS1
MQYTLSPSSQANRRMCIVMQHHRHSVNIFFKLSDYPILQKCVEDKSYRVMVFCAAEVSGVQNITFPHQCELRVNSDDIKANLRGLKNKPGSTRPVDITNALRLRPDYQNSIELIYALTNKVRAPAMVSISLATLLPSTSQCYVC